MDYSEKRITKLRDYLFNIIDTLIADNDEYQINTNMLSNDINNYSIDKIPTQTTVERWITGIEIHRDVFSFRSRMAYSQDVINNLSNIGFFEDFEAKIYDNNEKGILPEIDGIEKIECLNCGTMNFAETNTAEFDIQIQITYRNKI
jgi:hypothetical protein